MSERENILSALREKPLKVFDIMRRANISNEESCQSLLLRMRDEGSIKFDIHKGRWFIGGPVVRVTKHRFAAFNSVCRASARLSICRIAASGG
jgi:DNA-binding IclR family transcriptional regulator